MGIIRVVYLLLSDIPYLQQVLRDLYGVEGGALLNLVAHGPEGQAVRVAKILADAPYVNRIVVRYE